VEGVAGAAAVGRRASRFRFRGSAAAGVGCGLGVGGARTARPVPGRAGCAGGGVSDRHRIGGPTVATTAVAVAAAATAGAARRVGLGFDASRVAARSATATAPTELVADLLADAGQVCGLVQQASTAAPTHGAAAEFGGHRVALPV